MIPKKPTEDTDAAWLAWVNEHYPYDAEYADRIARTTARPKWGTEAELKLLSIFQPWQREEAANRARVWFYGLEHQRDIEAAQASDRMKRIEEEKSRLTSLAKQAIAGELGYTQQQKNDARATVQAYLTKSPELASYEELADWFLMHKYGQEVSRGRNPPRPRLHAERARAAEQKREVAAIDDAIGAEQGELGW